MCSRRCLFWGYSAEYSSPIEKSPSFWECRLSFSGSCCGSCSPRSSWLSSTTSTRLTRRMRPNERGALDHLRVPGSGALPGYPGPAREGYGPRTVERRGTRVRNDLRVPAPGRRDLHDLYVPRG